MATNCRHLAPLLLLISQASEAGLVPSPYDHGRPEIQADKAPVVIPGKAPIIHRPCFQGERELFGYAPRFMPGEVCFDVENRPYIRTTHLTPGTSGHTVANAGESSVQILNSDGRWSVYSLEEEVRKVQGDVKGKLDASMWAGNTRIVGDKAGDMYALAASSGKNLLLHLRKGQATWDVYQVPRSGLLGLEAADIYGQYARPPFVVSYYGGSLIDLAKKPDGTLSIPGLIDYAPLTSCLNPGHSGAGYATAKVGPLVYIVYGNLVAAKSDDGRDMPGTPEYCIAYDTESRKLCEPVLLGFGQNCYTAKPDDHNGPVVVADSTGILHVVLGAHNDVFRYLRSKNRNPSSRKDWTEAVLIGSKRRYDCGLTYTALAIDSQDTLHLVARNMSRGFDETGQPLPPDKINMTGMMMTLDYFRAKKSPDGTWKWEAPGPLVMPLWHQRYCVYYHRLVLDRKGRLFLSYYYYAENLSPEAVAVYQKNWPGETPEKGVAHDPVILMSDNGGDTWRLALTEDFLKGMDH